MIGSELTLVAQTGSIGGINAANPFLNVVVTDGDVTATADGYVQLQALELDLPVREIRPRTGRIFLRSDKGAILAPNPSAMSTSSHRMPGTSIST